MKKSILYTVGAALLGLFAFSTSASAASINTATPSLSVPTVTADQTEISGTATKNVNVYVKLNNDKQIATTTSSKDGKYTIKLPKKYAVNTKLYVYAQPSKSYNYFYRIVTVAAANTTTTTNNKTTTSKTSTSKTNTNTSTTNTSSTSSTTGNVKFNDLLGSWKSSASGKYTQLWTFNNDTGLDQTLYKNQSYDSKILSNATFNVKSINGNLIQMNYRGKGITKNSTMYIRLVSKTKFYLVDSNNKPLNVKVGQAPAATYTFTKTK
ncbi:Ig-like domain-containing protein [Lactobacillaceae bacterium Scapto_B20]